MESEKRASSPSNVAMKGTPKKSKKKRAKKSTRQSSPPHAEPSSSNQPAQANSSIHNGSEVVYSAVLDNEAADVSIQQPGLARDPLPPLPQQPAMSDRLTQLQNCLDDLAQRMTAALNWVSNHHPSATIEGQPFHGTDGSTIKKEKEKDASAIPVSDIAITTAVSTPGSAVEVEGNSDIPEEPAAFAAQIRELAKDLVLKEQQIEYLIGVLPVIGATQGAQEARIQELIKELEGLDEEAKEAAKVKQDLIDKVEAKILQCRRL